VQALRVARPTDQLEVVAAFYRDGLGLAELARFDDHDGFSGRVLGRADLGWHLELVAREGHLAGGAPDREHLLALYHDTPARQAAAVERTLAAGGEEVEHPNPYWNRHGRTVLDPDGYPVVLVAAPWGPAGGAASHEYDRLAPLYDAWYRAVGRDPVAEVDAVRGVLAEHGVTDPDSWLDVACGTGRHLRVLREHVDDVAGTDLSAAMLAVAAAAVPDVPLHHADMVTLDLGRTFDVVSCLFSSIGHVADAEHLDAAVAAMARHVAPAGVLVVEPWLTPELLVPGGARDARSMVIDDDTAVSRTTSSRVVDDVVVLDRVWSVARPTGVETFTEELAMPVFPRQRLLEAMSAAGLEPTWHHDADHPRGLLLGRRVG
jgi:SAM-dependent methyltransferase